MEQEEFLRSVLDTGREPTLVLRNDFKVRFANRAFCQKFHVSPDETLESYIFDLGNGQWNIPALRELLGTILPRDSVITDYEVTHDFQHLGERTMLINARKLFRPGNHTEMIFLSFEDVTDKRVAESLAKIVNERLKISVVESNHRVKNTLQLISAMLFMQGRKGGNVTVSDLNRLASHIKGFSLLHETLTLKAKEESGEAFIPVREIIEKLLETMRLGDESVTINGKIDDLDLSVKACSSLTIVINELITNSLKHGATKVDVELKKEKDHHHLEVCDNGPGFPEDFTPTSSKGVGFQLIRSLCKSDLGGEMKFMNKIEGGTCVNTSITLAKQNKN